MLKKNFELKVTRSFMINRNRFYVYIKNSFIECKRTLKLKIYETTLDQYLKKNRGKGVKKF